MKRNRHSAEQIVTKLHEAEAMLAAGRSVAQVVQHLGVSEQNRSECATRYNPVTLNHDLQARGWAGAPALSKRVATTAGEVRAIIDAEVGSDLSRSNSHGIDLRRCLVEPRKAKCRNTFPKLKGGKPLELWIVLEETPGTSTGYLIVFDEETHQFGLADWADSAPVFLGFHGSFLNTLEGM